MTTMTKKWKGDMVNLSLFETRGEAPRPLQERVNDSTLGLENSPSPEAAVFRTTAADEGGNLGTVENKGSGAVEIPRESLGGKGGTASTPGKDFSNIASILQEKYRFLESGRIEKGERIFSRSTREELLEYFFFRLAPSWPVKGMFTRRYFGVRVCFLKTQDLFYLKSICQDSVNRGGSFSRTFWGSIKPIAQPVKDG